MSTRLAQTSRSDLPQQHASCTGDRAFTGNANIRPASSMDSKSGDIGHHTPGTAHAKQPVSTQPVFTVGSGTAPVSPSKKRMHKDLKMRKGGSSATSTLPPRANPFAQYGVANGVASQASRTSGRGSPIAAAQPGCGSPQQSPRRVKVVRPSDGLQGMNLDSSMPPETSADEGSSAEHLQPAASSTFNGFTPQPSTARPHSGGSTAADMSCPLSSSRASDQPFIQTSTLFNGCIRYPSGPARPPDATQQPGTSSSSATPTSPSNQSQGTSAAAAGAGTDAQVTSTPVRFRFGARQAKPSPQRPFRGFGLHADDEQAAPDTPTAAFPGFQPRHQGEYSHPLCAQLTFSPLMTWGQEQMVELHAKRHLTSASAWCHFQT